MSRHARQQRVPHDQLAPLVREVRQEFNCSNDEALRMMGYAGGTQWAAWRRNGAPAVALQAAKGVLADLRTSTILTPPGTPAPELPLRPAPEAAREAWSDGEAPPGLLIVEEPEPQAESLLLEHPEPPAPLFTLDEASALFNLLINGQPPSDAIRHKVLGKLAIEIAGYD